MGICLEYQYEIARLIQTYTETKDISVLKECSKDMLIGIIVNIIREIENQK
jgi:hypothetical protein